LREYDPIVGRWLSTDPYREFASPYIGMGNNPVNYTDPDGGRICTTCPDGEEYDVFRESQFIFNYSEENGVQFSALNFATGFDEGAAGFNIDLSVLSGNAYNKSGGTALSFGAEVSVLNGSIDFRAGSRALGIIAGGEGTVLSASANLDAGWFSGQRGYTGALVDANIGVYTAKGEYYGGLTLGGISFRTVVGGSVLSAHAGITGGAYYNQESGEFILEGFEHLGFGIGEKVGVKIVIPVRAYMEGKVGL